MDLAKQKRQLKRYILLHLFRNLKTPIFVILSASICLHILGFFSITIIPKKEDKLPSTVSMKIIPKEEEPKSPVKKPPPKPKDKKPPKKQQLRGKKKSDKPPAKKIQGLSKDSLVKDSSVSAPAGNTLMEADKGVRLSPDEIQALEKNLSSDAILIQGSFEIPKYTQAALDADAEGKFIVDVFVNKAGEVVDAELRKKVGYGMDERIVESAKSSKFIPRKNAKGVPIEGWAEIKFYLQIP